MLTVNIASVKLYLLKRVPLTFANVLAGMVTFIATPSNAFADTKPPLVAFISVVEELNRLKAAGACEIVVVAVVALDVLPNTVRFRTAFELEGSSPVAFNATLYFPGFADDEADMPMVPVYVGSP